MPSPRTAARQQKIRAHIIESATGTVGRHGYAKATMARIAEDAGVAYGSIYLHFRGHDDLLAQLLPSVNELLRSAIRARSKGAQTFLDHEAIGFDVLFEVTLENPGRRRVFSEAPFYVPDAYDAYLARMAAAYSRVMHACKAKGEFPHLDEDQFETIAYSLMGAKQFLLNRFCHGDDAPRQAPANVRATYLKMVENAVSRP